MNIVQMSNERILTLPMSAEWGLEFNVENKKTGRVKVTPVFRSKRILHKGDKVTYIHTGRYWKQKINHVTLK